MWNSVHVFFFLSTRFYSLYAMGETRKKTIQRAKEKKKKMKVKRLSLFKHIINFVCRTSVINTMIEIN